MELLQMPEGARADYNRNCERGRGGFLPDWIVFHITYGSWRSLINCLTSDDPADYMRSSHIFAGRQGELYQMVYPNDTAWTCGLRPPRGRILHPNERALNIEMICEDNQIVSDQQYDSVRQIMKKLALDYNIPIIFPSTGFEGRWGSVNGVKTYICPNDDELLRFRGVLAHSAITKNRSGDPGVDHFDIHKLLNG